METEWVKTVKKQVLKESSEVSSFVTGTHEGAALSLRNYKFIDITTFLSGVFKAVARVKGLRQSKMAVFGQFNDEKYIADWWGPKKDVMDRLDNAKFEAQKQTGYF